MISRLKPTITINHVVITDTSQRSVVGIKQIYASHYFSYEVFTGTKVPLTPNLPVFLPSITHKESVV
jgi:hypothetical protein